MHTTWGEVIVWVGRLRGNLTSNPVLPLFQQIIVVTRYPWTFRSLPYALFQRDNFLWHRLTQLWIHPSIHTLDRPLPFLNPTASPRKIDISIPTRSLQISWNRLTSATVNYLDLEDLALLFQHVWVSCFVTRLWSRNLLDASDYSSSRTVIDLDLAVWLLDSLTVPCPLAVGDGRHLLLLERKRLQPDGPNEERLLKFSSKSKTELLSLLACGNWIWGSGWMVWVLGWEIWTFMIKAIHGSHCFPPHCKVGPKEENPLVMLMAASSACCWTCTSLSWGTLHPYPWAKRPALRSCLSNILASQHDPDTIIPSLLVFSNRYMQHIKVWFALLLHMYMDNVLATM